MRRLWNPIAVMLTVLTSATYASAGPIQLRFNVDIYMECTSTGCVDPDATFPVTLTFDGDLARIVVSSAGWITHYHGQPSFSDIPLARPAVDPGAVPINDFTVNVNVPRTDVGTGWQHIAEAKEVDLLLGTAFDYYWSTSLRAQSELSDTAEPLTLDSLIATFRDRPTFFNYSYGGVSRDGGGFSAGGVSYVGRAVLEEVSSPAAVPEPSTLLLTGSLLAVLAIRRRRSR